MKKNIQTNTVDKGQTLILTTKKNVQIMFNAYLALSQQ